MWGKKTTEDRVELYLQEEVRKLRGTCIKLPAIWYPGIPDRLVLLPGGVVIFMELKRPIGGKFEPGQPMWIRKLGLLGFPIYVCNTKEKVDEALATHQPMDTPVKRRVQNPDADGLVSSRNTMRPHVVGKTTTRSRK